MLMIALALILVAGIAFFQVLQGTFSAMIMTILSILCAMAALNYYEPLAAWILSLGQYQRDATYIYPASLIAVFFVPLLGVRLIFDRLLTGNVGFGLWADRIVGGVFGVITGMVLVGMLGIAMQMLPWDAAIIGYKPYDDCLQRDMSLQPLRPTSSCWRRPGSFPPARSN